MTLREELQRAVQTRDYLLRSGKSKRQDPEAIRRSMDLATEFLGHYPAASDERVREWCRSHVDDLCRILTGYQYKRLTKIMDSELRRRSSPGAKVIEMKPTNTAA